MKELKKVLRALDASPVAAMIEGDTSRGNLIYIEMNGRCRIGDLNFTIDNIYSIHINPKEVFIILK